MTDVLLLGGTGMLGHTIKAVLESEGISVVSTARVKSDDIQFDARADDIAACIAHAGNPPLIVNAIGIIKPHIDEGDYASRLQAIDVNGAFPHRLACAAEEAGSHVIQIATDCVYSGAAGKYDEAAPHDPWDVYGKSKSLGEVPHPNFTHLRCSIIGPEHGRSTSLWEWVRGQPTSASITGYTNHFWNGITTRAYARMCRGIITAGWREPGTFHVVPADIVSKATLVRHIALANGRDDIVIEDGLGGAGIDRTIVTRDSDINQTLWSIAGYEDLPTIEALVHEAATAG